MPLDMVRGKGRDLESETFYQTHKVIRVIIPILHSHFELVPAPLIIGTLQRLRCQLTSLEELVSSTNINKEFKATLWRGRSRKEMRRIVS